MKRSNRNILLVLGIICLIIGVTIAIPSFLQRTNLGLIASALFVIVGLILISIAYGN